MLQKSWAADVSVHCCENRHSEGKWKPDGMRNEDLVMMQHSDLSVKTLPVLVSFEAQVFCCQIFFLYPLLSFSQCGVSTLLSQYIYNVSSAALVKAASE